MGILEAIRKKGVVGLKIDIAGVLVSENEFGKADRYLRDHYLTREEQEEYGRFERAALEQGRWGDFIGYKVAMRNRLAEKNPHAIEDAFRIALGDAFIGEVREAVHYFKEKTGKLVALHSSMNPAVNNIFKSLIGADTVVPKFSGAPGIAIEDFEFMAKKGKMLEELAKKVSYEVKLGRYARFAKYPSEEEIRQAREALAKSRPDYKKILYFRGRAMLENWVDITNPTLPQVIIRLANLEVEKYKRAERLGKRRR